MSRKNLLLGLTDANVSTETPPPTGAAPNPTGMLAEAVRQFPARTVAFSSISRSVEQAKENAVLEIAPDLIEASLVQDRLELPPEELASLIESIRERGQLIPILVRPHPENAGRYQIAYGRRRLAAARALGQHVRAIVKALTDDELVIAQGQENIERKDLSYLERAVFAAKLEERGFSRPTIMSALSADKAALSKLITLATRIPRDVLEAIGAASKTGRDRWNELLSAIEQSPVALERVRDVVSRPDFSRRPSDDRFALALQAALSKPRTETTRTFVTAEDGSRIVRIRSGQDKTVFIVNNKSHEGFATFLAGELPGVYARFKARSPTESGADLGAENGHS